LRALPELLKAMQDVGLQSFSGHVYRIVPYKHRGSPLSTMGALLSNPGTA
jgi:hypothetical protein